MKLNTKNDFHALMSYATSTAALGAAIETGLPGEHTLSDDRIVIQAQK